MFKNNHKITFQEVKRFLKSKGFKILKKSNYEKKFANNSINFLITALCSLALILFFYLTPIAVTFYNNHFDIIKEVKNNSKNDLEKVLSGKSLEVEKDNDLNQKEIFEDILRFENEPTDAVRLSASTIEQLFKDTNYTLDKVRKNKMVKPINLSLLPYEMKMIESSKKRKNLFIKIILPLILEENNQIKINRKKLFAILNKNSNSASEKKWLDNKFKQYGIKNRDLTILKIRMDEIPVSLAIAQAAKETGWGTSRFALEGNALFGQWTYSGEGLKPLGADNDQTHKVMKFNILKASVKAYKRNLNTHTSYKEFRKARAELRDNDEKLNSLYLANYLNKYAETGDEYTKILKQIIKQNSLMDFDDVRLLPTSIKLKNLI